MSGVEWFSVLFAELFESFELRKYAKENERRADYTANTITLIIPISRRGLGALLKIRIPNGILMTTSSKTIREFTHEATPR